MKRQFINIIIGIVTITIIVVAYVIPSITLYYDLSNIRHDILIIIVIAISAVLSAGAFEYSVTIPLREFLEKTEQAWETSGSLNALSLPKHNDELERISKTINAVVTSNAKRIAELESMAGYTETYQRLVTTMSHQLRTPITGLNWALSSMRDDISKGVIPDEALVAGAHEASERIGTLVEELLVGIREKDSTKAVYRPIDIEQAVERILKESALSAKQRHIRFSVTKKQSPLPLIHGNEQEVRFALHSVITNAVYYSNEGGTVSVVLDHDGTATSITVHNNGPAIPENEKAIVFSQFGRGDQAIRVNPDGSGLGLYLTKKIVVDHGGSISFDSNTKDGTSFKIAFPLSNRGQLETFIHY